MCVINNYCCANNWRWLIETGTTEEMGGRELLIHGGVYCCFPSNKKCILVLCTNFGNVAVSSSVCAFFCFVWCLSLLDEKAEVVTVILSPNVIIHLFSLFPLLFVAFTFFLSLFSFSATFPPTSSEKNLWQNFSCSSGFPSSCHYVQIKYPA